MKLEDMTITSQQQKDIEALIETKITHVLGGRRSKANTTDIIRIRTAVEFLHDFYEHYNITGYSELRTTDFQIAKEYVMKWQPKFNIKLEIEQLNRKEGKVI